MSFIGNIANNFEPVKRVGGGAAVAISSAATRLRRRDNSERHSFAFKRADVFAAFINSAALIAVSLFLCYQAVLRLFHPQVVEGNIMIFVAVIGLAANVAGTLLLKRDAARSLNVKATYLHMLGDAVSPVGEHDIHAEAHVAVDDMLIGDGRRLRQQIENLLMERFEVMQVTLQLECGDCEDLELVKRRSETGGTDGGEA